MVRQAGSARRARLMRSRLSTAAVYLVLAIGAIAILVPFLFQISTSLKDDAQVNIIPTQWIPNPVHWDNYVSAFTALPFNVFFMNTVLVEAGVLSGALLSGIMAAYAFARLDAPFKNTLFLVMLSTLMLPNIITLVPSYFIFVKLHWVDTLLPLIVPAWFSAGYATNIFLLRQFFLGIPNDLGEAALMDGAGTLMTMFRIYVPLAKPAIATITIMMFIAAWHDFFNPLIYLNTERHFTLALGINEFISQVRGQQTHWNLVQAASMSIILPPVLLFLFFQRFFIEGITLGGVKG
jgi:multiple sugar transport system permease protein